MDRTIVLIFVLVLLPTLSFAIPAEGDFFPAPHKSIWGIQFNHIFSRDFNKVEGQASMTQYFIRASYGLTKKLFLDGKIGWGNVEFDRNLPSKIDFPTNFAGGYGFRYLFYEDTDSGIKSIFGFQHVSCHPHKSEIDGVKYTIIWDEWQGSWLLIKSGKKMSFYFGPQYSVVQLKYKVDGLRRRLKAEDSWGAVLGSDYRLTKNISVNVEARFFDERALNVGVNYKF